MKKTLAFVALAAMMLAAGCTAQPGGNGQNGNGGPPRVDPNPGVEDCRDTDKPGYQRVCIEISTYCDGHATPFGFQMQIQAVGMDGVSLRKWRDPQTGAEMTLNLTLQEETKLHPTEDQALMVIAVDYLMQIPPTLLVIEATSSATATRGCDAFLALSAPQTRLEPHGRGLLGSGQNDMDYFLVEQDFVPMVLISHLEIPYL